MKKNEQNDHCSKWLQPSPNSHPSHHQHPWNISVPPSTPLEHHQRKHQHSQHLITNTAAKAAVISPTLIHPWNISVPPSPTPLYHHHQREHHSITNTAAKAAVISPTLVTSAFTSSSSTLVSPLPTLQLQLQSSHSPLEHQRSTHTQHHHQQQELF